MYSDCRECRLLDDIVRMEEHICIFMWTPGWRTICQRLVVLAVLQVPGVARRCTRADCADDLRGCRDPDLAVDVPPAVCGEIIAVTCAGKPDRACWCTVGVLDRCPNIRQEHR